MKKIIPLYVVPLSFSKIAPTAVMLTTLKKCAEMEQNYPGRPYGPSDIAGSFIGLYNRGLIDVGAELDQRSWFVTTAGFLYLLSRCKY
jgi:hypothetical protein